MTTKELTDRYNKMLEALGKPTVKLGSYSKAQLQERMAKMASEAPAPVEPAKPAKKRSTDDAAIGAKEVFTLPQLCRQLNINPRIARARYRKVDNDGLRTRYIFPFSTEEVARVTAIIAPKA
jgi:hypothetical protein